MNAQDLKAIRERATSPAAPDNFQTACNDRKRLLSALEASEKRLKLFADLVWDSRVDSDEQDYLHTIGIAAEINSGNYDGIDRAIRAIHSKDA